MNQKKLPNDVFQFLDQNHFFDYQDFDNYSALIDRQLTDRLDLTTPLVLAIPILKDTKLSPIPPFLVLDLGGTYLRLYLCENKIGTTQILAEHKLPFYQDKIYTPEILIEDLSKAIQEFSKKNPAPWKQIIFSFANAVQPQLKDRHLDGKILYWGKQHKQKGLLGTWLGTKLEQHLRENGHPECTVQLINDGTLSALAGLPESTAGDSMANLIVGTGTNINVAFTDKENLYSANLEFGDFEFAPYSNFDEQLNVKVSTPNHFRTEKMFSGAWQGLLFETVLEFALRSKLINSKEVLQQIKNYNSGELENIFNSSPSENSALKLPPEDWETCRILWNQINMRGAALCAFAISRLVVQLQNLAYLKNRLLLVPSGALLEHCPTFQEHFQETLRSLMATTPQLKKQEIIFIKPKNTTCQAAGALLQALQPS